MPRKPSKKHKNAIFSIRVSRTITHATINILFIILFLEGTEGNFADTNRAGFLSKASKKTQNSSW